MTIKIPAFAAALVSDFVAAHTHATKLSAAPPQVSTPVFYRDVLPILQQHCQSCHRTGEIAPMPLVTYDDARSRAKRDRKCCQQKKNAAMVRRSATTGISRMIHRSRRRKSQTLICLGETRTRPLGDADDAPPPRQWTQGWNIPQPDVHCADAEAGRVAGARRRGVHLRNRAHRIHGRQMGADVRDSPVQPRERSSRRRLHPPARFELAAARAGRYAVHRLGHDRRRQIVATRTGPTRIFCSFTRPEALRTIGPQAWRNSFPQARIWCSRCTT